KLYLQTTRHLYCWGNKGNNPGCPAPEAEKPWPSAGRPTQLQLIPSELLLHPADKAHVRVRSLDENGLTVQDDTPLNQVKFASYVPPTAKVKSTMRATFDGNG